MSKSRLPAAADRAPLPSPGKTAARGAGHTLARDGRVIWPSRAFFDEHCLGLSLTDLPTAQAAVAAKVAMVTRATPALAGC